MASKTSFHFPQTSVSPHTLPNTPTCAPASQGKHRNHYWAFFQHPSAKSASPSLQCFSPVLRVQRKKEGLPPSKSVRVLCIPSLLTFSGTFYYTCPVSLYNWVLSLFTRPRVDATLPSALWERDASLPQSAEHRKGIIAFITSTLHPTLTDPCHSAHGTDSLLNLLPPESPEPATSLHVHVIWSLKFFLSPVIWNVIIFVVDQI